VERLLAVTGSKPTGSDAEQTGITAQDASDGRKDARM
jgi:hypothetical protein